MAEETVITTKDLEQLWKEVQERGVPPYRDPETGKAFYLLTCAPGSPGGRWANDFPERLRIVDVPRLGPCALLPDPDKEPSLWAYLRGER